MARCGTAADSARHGEISFAAGDNPAAFPSGRNVMTAEHHPSDVVLFALAAGTLDETERVETATHVRECASCRAFVRAMEHVGGIVLEELPPMPMASGSLSELLARIEQPDLSPSASPGNSSVSRSPSRGRRWFGGEGTSPRPASSAGAADCCGYSPVRWRYLFHSRKSSVPPSLGAIWIEGNPHYGGVSAPHSRGHAANSGATRLCAAGRREPSARLSAPARLLSHDRAARHHPGEYIEEFSYLVLGNNRAMRYAIGVGRDCFQWQGFAKVSHKTEWPDWTPAPEAIAEQPDLPRFMAGGPGNPLGARAIYLSDAGYRIHGTNAPEAIGAADGGT